MYNPSQARDPLGKWVKEHGGASIEDVVSKTSMVDVTFSPACGGGGFLLKNPSGFSIDRLSPHALWFVRFMSRATR